MKFWTYFALISFFTLSSIGFIIMKSEEVKVVEPGIHHDGGIPDQAVRLRILANSDSLEDQVLKRKVRDEIIKEIKSWTDRPQDILEAREVISRSLPRFAQIAQTTTSNYGFTYPVKVDFGKVPFPTKLYGEQIYPAGNYEALRITIGEGKGDNWWCVLFPPLCFIDMSNGDAVRVAEASTKDETEAIISSTKHLVQSVDESLINKENMDRKTTKTEEDIVEIRFLFVGQLFKLFK